MNDVEGGEEERRRSGRGSRKLDGSRRRVNKK